MPVQLFHPTLVQIEGENGEPGTARLLRREGSMMICCAYGSTIKVERVKSQGKKEVGVNDWWNGLPRALRECKAIKLGS